MGDAEKKWREQYKINPQVRRETTKDGMPMYVGFDDQLKPYEELTEEEVENYLARHRQEITSKIQIGEEKTER